MAAVAPGFRRHRFMSALPYIAAALGLGGLYLWWRSKQTNDGKPNDVCAMLCAAAGPYCVDGGASCRAAGNLWDAITQSPGDKFRTQRATDQATNDKLNGAIDVLNPESLDGDGRIHAVQSTVLRYKNGCVPLAYAPGFSKCAPGTLDMYQNAIATRAGVTGDGTTTTFTEAGNVAPDASQTIAQAQSAAAARAAAGEADWRHVNKDHAMTGQSGDPTTHGPWSTAGQPTWYVRGKRVQCAQGKAPRAVMLQAYGDAQAITEEAGRQCVDVFADPRVTSTQGGCANGMPTIPGTTWDPSINAWRRLRAGETVNPGPCAQATSINVATATSHGLVISK